MSEKHSVYTNIARFYDLLDLPFEYFRYRKLRKILWQGIKGRILDAGVGTGRNMPYYPDDSNVTGIDLSSAMLGRAHLRKQKTGANVDLLERDVCDTGFSDDAFDFVISSFLFCVLDDELQRPALVELKRICRPGGEIRILEYAYSKKPFKRFIMKLWAPWVKFAYGATFDRNTEQYVEAADLQLVKQQFIYGDIIKILIIRA